MQRFITCFVLFACIGILVFAQSEEQKVALIIGNSEYSEAPLQNPANDATDVGRRLATLGFSVTVLTNATQEQMEEAAYRFGNELSTGGVGFFYYAGHGAQYNGENYLIPVDAKIRAATELRYKALSAGLILSYMSEARNRLNMIILDACRDNPFAGARSATRGLAVVDQLPTGSVIVYATAPGKTAQDGTGRNSPFTEAFLEHVDTAGLGVKEMFDLVGRDVSDTTLGQQRPWISHDFYDEFEFAGTDAPTVTPAESSEGSSTTPTTTPVSQQFGELFIVTEPDGAKISVNDEEMGQSPLFLAKMPLQTRLVITAEKEGWFGSKEITLTTSELVDIAITLEAETGNLVISSSEKDVDVYFDGELLGSLGTGLFRDLATGIHSIEVQADGLYWQGDVAIQADQTVQLQVQPQSVETGMEGVTLIEFREAELPEQITPAGDEDWYVVDIGGLDSMYLFTARTSGETDTYIEIYGPNDRDVLVGQNDDGNDQNASATILVNNRERYWIKVRGYGSDTTGAYALHTDAEAYLGDALEPNDTRAAALALQIEGPGVATTLIPASDRDWFAIQLSREPDYNAYLSIETLSAMDTVMTLYWGDEEVATDDDGGEDSNARIVYRPERTGTYYVEVASYDAGELGEYEIVARWIRAYPDRYESDNELDDAKNIDLDGAIQARNFIPGDDIDWLRIEIEDRETIRIQSFGSTDIYFTLHDRFGEVIIEDDDSGDEYNAMLNPTLEPGTYYLMVTQLDQGLFGSEYEIEISRSDESTPLVEPGETVEIDPNGPFYEAQLSRNGQEDWYTFEVTGWESEHMVVISTTGGTDTYIELYGPNFEDELLTENDDGNDSNAMVTTVAATGDRFWVLVRGYSSDTLGDYQLHVRTEPYEADALEPNDSPEEATPLSIDGELVMSSLIPGTDIDWFRIRISSIPSRDAFLAIETFSDMDTTLELYYGEPSDIDDEDDQLAFNDDGGSDSNARLLYQPTRTGTFYALVRNYDASVLGRYEIIAEWVDVIPDEYEPDNERDEATRIQPDGEPQFHTFTPGDDVDWFRVDVREAGIIEFRTYGDTDTFFTLYDENGDYISEDDDGGGNYNALLSPNLERGVYFLEITQVGDTFGSEYEVAVMPGGINAAGEGEIVEIEVNTVFEDGRLSRMGEQDWYEFVVYASETEQIIQVFTTGDTDTYIELYGPESPDELITENDDGSDSNAKVSTLAVGGDRFWVKVRGYDEGTTGSYQLHVLSETFEPDPFEPNDYLEEAKPLRIDGEPVAASIIPGQDLDWYEISIERIPLARKGTERYLLVETTGGLDTTIEMYDEDEDFFGSDDDGGIENNARLIVPIDYAGTYYVEVRHFDGTGMGRYEIIADWIEGNPDEFEPDNDMSEATLYQIGSMPQWHNFSPGHEADWVKFTLRSEEEVQIMTYGDADTYIVIYDDDEEPVAEDDDSGSNYNALLRLTLEPGTYYAEVTQIDEYFETDYRLSIQYGFTDVDTGNDGH